MSGRDESKIIPHLPYSIGDDGPYGTLLFVDFAVPGLWVAVGGGIVIYCGREGRVGGDLGRGLAGGRGDPGRESGWWQGGPCFEFEPPHNSPPYSI